MNSETSLFTVLNIVHFFQEILFSFKKKYFKIWFYFNFLQMSWSLLRESLRVFHFRLRRVVLHGLPSPRPEHQRHLGDLRNLKTKLASRLQLRKGRRWKVRLFGGRARFRTTEVVVGRRPNGDYVTGFAEAGRHWPVVQSDGHAQQQGRITECWGLYRIRRILQNLSAGWWKMLHKRNRRSWVGFSLIKVVPGVLNLFYFHNIL